MMSWAEENIKLRDRRDAVNAAKAAQQAEHQRMQREDFGHAADRRARERAADIVAELCGPMGRAVLPSPRDTRPRRCVAGL